jgi:hypothetical protein
MRLGTTTSVFDLIWDIVIAFFIIRLALFYFGLSFVTGCIIAHFRISNVTPLNHFTSHQSALVTLSVWLVSNTIWARFIIVAYDIPRVALFRIAIGGVGLVFMLVAELLSGVFMYEKGWVTWIWEVDPMVNFAVSGALLLFGLMPLLLMGLESGSGALHKRSRSFEMKTATSEM